MTVSRRPSAIEGFVPRNRLTRVFAREVATILAAVTEEPRSAPQLAALTGLSTPRTRRICEQLAWRGRIVRAEKWGPWTVPVRQPSRVVFSSRAPAEPVPLTVLPPPDRPSRTVVVAGEVFEVTHCGADRFADYTSRGGSSLSSDAFRLRTHR